MLLGAEQFLAELDNCYVLSIEGWKRSGKDLLAMELAHYYLQRGYGLYTNQKCIWSDPLYKMNLVENGDGTNRWELQLQEVEGRGMLPIPCVKHKVLILSEGGAYLRERKYFGNINRFAGKMDDYIIIPSTETPHEMLSKFRCENFINFRTFVGLNGGLFLWTKETGRKPLQGFFIFIPTLGYGLYDDKDYSENTNALLKAIDLEIDITQRREYGRDGIQTVGFSEEAADMAAQSEISRRVERAAVSLSQKR